MTKHRKLLYGAVIAGCLLVLLALGIGRALILGSRTKSFPLHGEIVALLLESPSQERFLSFVSQNKLPCMMVREGDQEEIIFLRGHGYAFFRENVLREWSSHDKTLRINAVSRETMDRIVRKNGTPAELIRHLGAPSIAYCMGDDLDLTYLFKRNPAAQTPDGRFHSSCIVSFKKNRFRSLSFSIIDDLNQTDALEIFL